MSEYKILTINPGSTYGKLVFLHTQKAAHFRTALCGFFRGMWRSIFASVYITDGVHAEHTGAALSSAGSAAVL